MWEWSAYVGCWVSQGLFSCTERFAQQSWLQMKFVSACVQIDMVGYICRQVAMCASAFCLYIRRLLLDIKEGLRPLPPAVLAFTPTEVQGSGCRPVVKWLGAS